MTAWLHRLPFLAGPTLVAGLVAGFVLGWTLPTPAARLYGYVAATGVMLALLAVELLLGLRPFTRDKLRAAAAPFWLALAAAGWLVMVETLAGKLAVVLAAGFIIGSYQSHLQIPVADRPVDAGFLERRPGLPRAAFITDLFTLFYLTAFVFGLEAFFQLPQLLVALLMGLVWFGLVYENLWRFGVANPDRLSLAAVFSLAGLELQLVLAMLPVSYLTKSAAAALIFGFGLHFARQIVLELIQPKTFRGEALAFLGLLALLLLTAKWL
jgi:hypothetical protein